MKVARVNQPWTVNSVWLHDSPELNEMPALIHYAAMKEFSCQYVGFVRRKMHSSAEGLFSRNWEEKLVHAAVQSRR